MATDIESLIRQALARQNAFDPEVRQKIYQSSRNALAKMIAKAGVVPPQVINARSHSLEETIAKIEAEFTTDVNSDRNPVASPPVEENNTVAPPTSPQEPLRRFFDPGLASAANPANPVDPVNQVSGTEAPSPQVAPTIAPNIGNSPFSRPSQQNPGSNIEPSFEPAAPEPAPITTHINLTDAPSSPDQGEIGEADQHYASPTPQYARPRRKPIRIIIWLLGAAILAIVGWVAYTLTLSIIDPQSSTIFDKPAAQTSEVENKDDFITILDPEQPGALITAGNGTAEILSEISVPAIRIVSVRKPDAHETPADPLLLELAPGILKNIAGKRVTVEIMAKSGDSGAATFAVSCDFGDLGDCGRKRFRIGLQPEAVIFSIEISGDLQEGQRAFLAINTDVTSSAAISGKGAKIDIVYARIRITE